MSPKKSLVLALVCLSLAWLTACSGAQEQAQQPAATAPATQLDQSNKGLTDADLSALYAQPQLANQQQPSSQSQGAFDGAGSSSRQSDDGARQGRQERQPNQETRHDQDAAPQLRRGPVYL